jgi:hypothetical protein
MREARMLAARYERGERRERAREKRGKKEREREA